MDRRFSYQPPYERFAPLLPPQARDRRALLPPRPGVSDTQKWTLRFGLLTGGDEHRAMDLATNRDVVFAVAGVAAGLGLVLGLAIGMARSDTERKEG